MVLTISRYPLSFSSGQALPAVLRGKEMAPLRPRYPLLTSSFYIGRAEGPKRLCHMAILQRVLVPLSGVPHIGREICPLIISYDTQPDPTEEEPLCTYRDTAVSTEYRVGRSPPQGGSKTVWERSSPLSGHDHR